MIQEIRNIKSGKKELRDFGITIFAAMCVIAGISWWFGKVSAPYLMAAGIIFLLAGLLFPSALKPAQKIWMAFSIIMGTVMTAVILSVFFYTVITAIGFLARLSGNELLGLKLKKDAHTYWVPKEKKTAGKKSYESQF